MKKEISRKLKLGRMLSILIILIGALLMTYMIKVESEPGALPLFLTLAGIVWLVITQYQIKKQLQ